MARDPSRDLWGRNGGLYMGFECTAENKGRPDLSSLPAQIITDRHVVLTGPNGSGKTRGFVYPNALTLLGWSQVILDFKGEIFHNTARHRRANGNDVVVLNPFKVRGIPSSGYNPVLSLRPNEDTYVDDCDALAQILSPAEGTDRHFDEAAQDLISIPLLNSGFVDDTDASLSYARRLINLSASAMQAEMRKIAKRADQEGLHELAGRTTRFRQIASDDRELKSIISTARTKLRWLDSKPIYDDLNKGDYPWEKMKESPTTVYLILPANRIYQHRNWLKLILHCILSRLLNDPTPSKVPILFQLDEAAQIAGIPLIEQNMAMLRGFGIKIASIYQDYPQASLALGKRIDSYLANAGVLLGYAPQDFDTADLLSKRGGVTSTYQTSYSASQEKGDIYRGSFGMNQNQREAVLPQDLMNMPPGYAVMYSHQHAGARTMYFPDPSKVPEFRVAMQPPLGTQ